MRTVEDPMNARPNKKYRNDKKIPAHQNSDPFGNLPWVHTSMKAELDAAYELSDEEFKHCCNWWFCLISWKKRDLHKEDEIQFTQKEWSTLASKLNFQDDGSVPKSNEPIIVRVIR